MTAGGKGAEGDVDLEDKIIKEVRWAIMGFHLVIDMVITGRKMMLIMNLNLLPCSIIFRCEKLPTSTLECITSNVKPQTRWAINYYDYTTTATGIGNKSSPRRSETSCTRSSRWPSQLGAN